MSMKRDEENAKKVLDEYGVQPYVYYFFSSDFGRDEYVTGRISGVTVVWHLPKKEDALSENVRMAIANATVDSDQFLYAGNLKRELEELGIYGVSIWDARDTRFKLLSRAIATGRLRRAYERGLCKAVTVLGG